MRKKQRRMIALALIITTIIGAIFSGATMILLLQ